MTSKNKKLMYLRAQWGKQVDKFRNFDLISIYHNNVVLKDSINFVDEKTWSDLELDKVFSKMDRNLSSIGQQYLYHLLHKYERNNKILEERFSLIQFFRKNSTVRESIQFLLSNLANTKAYFIPSIIMSNIPSRSKYFYFLILQSSLTLTSVTLILFQPYFFFITLALLIINIILNHILSSRIYDYFAGFTSLYTMLIAARQMSKIKSEYPIKELKFLNEQKGLIKKLNKKLGKFIIDKEGLNEIARVVIEYFNMFFLFDLIAYYKSVNILIKYQPEVKKIYESMANLDACISVASYLEDIEKFTKPIFINKDEISFDNIYHPLLLDGGVPNTINQLPKSALITGSNMSGKTTFIKCVGINLILAQTLFFCHADKFETKKYKVKAAIKREEDLEQSKSYFFVEIEELQKFIQLAEENNDHIYLIDEIFRGTNTIERLAISTSVLEYLNQYGKVLVTTHDIELQDLLENTYEMYHFGDKVNGDEFYFDYKIQKGPCYTGNAIDLLKIKGYPVTITNKAKKIAAELSSINIIEKS